MVRQQVQTERQQTDPGREGNSISAQNFAGLNTVANPITIPYEDSPVFTNVFTNDQGGVQRRPGTAVLGTIGANWLQPITTAYGYNLMLSRDVNFILVDEIKLNSTGQFYEKQSLASLSGVFSDFVTDSVRPNSVVISRPGEQQVWITTGVDCPVVVRFVEYRATITLSGTTTNTLPQAQRIQGMSFLSLVSYYDGVANPVSVSIPSGEDLIITNANNPGTGDATVDVIGIVWNWAAEAYFYYGDRFTDTTTRFHTTNTADVLQEIPENIRDGLIVNDGFFGGDTLSLNVLYNTGGSYHAVATQVTNQTPTTAYEFCGSQPSIKLAAASAHFGDNYIQWGAVDGTKAATPETVVFNRIRDIPFNGGRDTLTEAQYVHVSVAGTTGNKVSVFPPVGSYGDYFLYETDGTGPTTVATDATGYISFAGSILPYGLKPNDEVKIVYTEPKYCGSSATSSSDHDLNGSWVPFYGIGQYADYGAFSFPSTIAFYQDRIALAGCPHDPLRTFLSSTSDTSVPGEYYQFFQQDAFTSLDTDPLDVVLQTGTPDDRVTSMLEFQGSLFIGTTTGLYRLAAPSRAAITSSTALVSTVANEEVFNNQCLLVAEDSMFVYNGTGVYIVESASSFNTVEYFLTSISSKVHDIFDQQPKAAARTVAWLGYSEPENALYVGVASERSTTVASRLLRFGLFRQSWSEYTMPSGFNTTAGATVKRVDDERLFVVLHNTFDTFTVAADGTFDYGTPTDTLMLNICDKETYLDRLVRVVSTGSPVGYNNITTLPQISYTADADAQFYRIPWDVHPVSDVQDIRVTANAAELAFGSDYVKKDNSILLFTPAIYDTQTLIIYYDNPDPDTADRYLNEIYYDQFLDTTATPTIPTSSSGVSVFTLISYGSTYQSVYSTPLFTWGSLGAIKRLIYWAGLFSNKRFRQRWVLEDYSASNQHSQTDIVDQLKFILDANISFVYDSDDNLVDTSSDLYLLSAIYNDGQYDLANALQYDQEVNIKQALQGVGYSFRAVVWNSNTTTFELLGYQIEGRAKGARSRHWSE